MRLFVLVTIKIRLFDVSLQVLMYTHKKEGK